MQIRNDNRVLTRQFLLLLLPLPAATAQESGAGMISAPPGPEVSKNMAIAFVALISAFFLLGLFSVYTRRCRERRFGRGLGIGGGGGGMSWRPARGLDPAFIATFPTFVYSTVKGLKIGKSSLECAVCLNEFENSDTLRLIPKCSHVFHAVCVDAWLVAHSTCPVCRANLCPKLGEVTKPTGNFDPTNDLERIVIEPSPMTPPNPVSIAVADDCRAREEAGMEANRSPPPRSRSLGWRFSGMFQRSNSTGHERFTLRLPAEVRSQLMNSTLNRARSWAELPRVHSSRRGFRRNLFSRTLSVPAPVVGMARTDRSVPEEEVGERSFARLRPSGIGPSTAAD